ncbi:unnamed protein product [Caenorhabditis angaria]|uniref:F-box domain-containing protein n=1 Tax=Caenorhabditis angaria TaxID=860376 RepID=A0A9P1MYH1_9PELO|nr:unnamed protein product [Caenorhabditis angaria]
MEVDEKLDTIGWFDMPFEMREIVINYMDLATKIQFSQCSKLCFEEVQLPDSRYFAVGIHYSFMGEKDVVFEMWHNELDDCYVRTVFLVCAPNQSEDGNMNSRTISVDQLIEVETKEKVIDYVMYLLRGILKFPKNCLRILMIYIPNFPYNKMKIENNLNTLETISLSCNNQINPVNCGFIGLKQLCSIKDKVFVSNLTIDQIIQLKARSISVGYDGSEKFDIEHFVNRLFSDGNDQIDIDINFGQKQDLDNIPGIYAKRNNGSGIDYLFKQRDKMTRMECRKNESAMSSLLFSRFPATDFKESEWTIL